MLKECSEDILKFLKENDRNEVYTNVKCFIKEEERFNIYIFTMFFDDGQHLKEKWKIFNNDLAWYFQSKLKTQIERWNMYILYFVKDKVDRDLKYEIQQDKYCTRKIIIDKLYREISMKEIENIIINKLFNIEIGVQRKSDYTSISNIIEENDKKLFDLINSGLSDQEILNKYLSEDIYED